MAKRLFKVPNYNDGTFNDALDYWCTSICYWINTFIISVSYTLYLCSEDHIKKATIDLYNIEWYLES